MRTDGSLGPETTRGREVGGDGGNSGARSCPGGSVVSGLKMKVGAYVDSVFLVCREWRAASRDMGTAPADGLHAGGYGGLASVSHTLKCESSRQPGAGIRGRAGGVVDAIGLVCNEP